jgi:hypothetical protein
MDRRCRHDDGDIHAPVSAILAEQRAEPINPVRRRRVIYDNYCPIAFGAKDQIFPQLRVVALHLARSSIAPEPFLKPACPMSRHLLTERGSFGPSVAPRIGNDGRQRRLALCQASLRHDQIRARRLRL